MDLSMLSRDDLMALREGDLSRVSDAGLKILRASDKSQPKQKTAGEMALEGMSGPERFAAGAGKAIVDTGRGLRQLARSGLDLISPREGQSRSAEDMAATAEDRARDAALMDSGAGLAGNIVGNIGMALAPGGALKGAGILARGTAAAPVLSVAGSALLAPKSISGAAALGAGMGAIQPVASDGERGTNMAIGGVVNAAVPVVARGVQAAKAAVAPFHEGGQREIIGGLLRRSAGDQADVVAQRLANAGEIVPGSSPTVAQAAGNPGIAAVERAASAIDPSVTTAYGNRMAQQNAARVAALEGVSGEVAAAKAARDSASRSLYEAAKQEIVTGDKTIETLIARPSMKKAWARAQQLAAEQGEDIFLKGTPAKEISQRGADGIPRIVNQGAETAEYSVKGLHYLKLAIDDLIENPATAGIGANEARAINGTKKELLSWLDDKVPQYKAARTKYAEMSKPVNQAQIVDELVNKSVHKLTGNIQSNAYARNLSDETAARATGFGGATLANTMTPDQLGVLNAIRQDLARSTYAQNAGRGAGSDTVQKLAYSNLIDSAGVPTWLRAFPPAQAIGNIASRGADALYGRANREMANRLALGLLNPQEAALAMEAAAAKSPGLLRLLQPAAAPLTLAAPGLLNAQKQ